MESRLYPPPAWGISSGLPGLTLIPTKPILPADKLNYDDAMRFYVTQTVKFVDGQITLVPSTWDDYGYETKFTMHITLSGESHWIGDLKILCRKKRQFITRDVLAKQFDVLDASQFCSLGQETAYYARLGQLPEGYGLRVLKALNDVCFTEANDWWTPHDGFKTTILRQNAAHLARLDATTAFAGKPVARDMRHEIRYERVTRFAGGPENFNAFFDGELKVPGRLNVIVGKNASGKTSLLAGMAYWFSQPAPKNQFEYRPDFSRVIVVTFNPFDTSYRSYISPKELGNVRFVGRQPISSKTLNSLVRLVDSPKFDEDTWLDLIEKAFFSNAELFRSTMRSLLLGRTVKNTLETLQNDPQWEAFILEAFFEEPDLASTICSDPDDALDAMSAGQLSLVTLYAELFVNLESRALVLIDEPENHLHPSLIARFIRAFNEMLAVRKAYAIIATHSPVIVQETPSRFVSILQRDGNVTVVRTPDTETFGDSIDNISQKLFDTDFRSSHWKKVLRAMASEALSLDEVAQQISGQPLSLLAGSYYSYLLHTEDGE